MKLKDALVNDEPPNDDSDFWWWVQNNDQAWVTEQENDNERSAEN